MNMYNNDMVQERLNLQREIAKIRMAMTTAGRVERLLLEEMLRQKEEELSQFPAPARTA